MPTHEQTRAKLEKAVKENLWHFVTSMVGESQANIRNDLTKFLMERIESIRADNLLDVQRMIQDFTVQVTDKLAEIDEFISAQKLAAEKVGAVSPLVLSWSNVKKFCMSTPDGVFQTVIHLSDIEWEQITKALDFECVARACLSHLHAAHKHAHACHRYRQRADPLSPCGACSSETGSAESSASAGSSATAGSSASAESPNTRTRSENTRSTRSSKKRMRSD